jgi:N-acetylmuramoyl-L-alanine amidase
MKKLLVILDAGHGGMIDGVYTTAPSKMHKFPNGEIAYEGVINRNVKNQLISLLLKEGIAFTDVTKGDIDYTLGFRVSQANKIYNQFKETHECLYLSIHSNAGGGTGFEVWTYIGQTKSDKYAEIWSEEIKKSFPEYPFRADTADGDLDKESKFYVLKETHMPAVLGELLFFDNWKDYRTLCDPNYPKRAAQTILNFLNRSKNELL